MTLQLAARWAHAISQDLLCCSALSLLLCRMMSDWKVDLVNDNISEFHVQFKGPGDSETGP